ncbi:hypothetical protein OsJ_20637 [Oryza sativa Japonica Group]|uniref:NPH3 domain-containing protein n=1 Tax=Oryza sativa subsp. japonica TaxID=39947 RepID=A3B9S7_ORYSJ|nr:hypothetical protein OsJ_20637 [Oryza sativa Japonica Group]
MPCEWRRTARRGEATRMRAGERRGGGGYGECKGRSQGGKRGGAKREKGKLSRQFNYIDGSHHDTWGVVLLDMEQRVLKEEIVTLLPIERGIAMMRFVLGLLCTDMILHAGMYRDTLEKEATHEDLLIPNTGNFVETPYDVDCMERMPTNTSVLATSPKI